MTVALTGTGGIWTRLGKILKWARSIQGARAETLAVGDTNDTGATWGSGGATVVDAKTAVNAIEGQYQSALQYVVDGLYTQEAAYRSAQKGTLSYLQKLAQTTLIEQVHADATLPQKTLALAMKELIRQMVATSDSVKANTVTAAVSAAGTNVGNATITCSVKAPSGLTTEYAFPEVMDFLVTTDRFNGGTQGSEKITVAGELAEKDSLNWNWPDGSSAGKSLTIVDQSIDGSSTGNLLTNSDFETFVTTANVPDSWTLLVGTAGTTVKKNVSVLYGSRSAASLEFVGDGGGTLSSITQDITTLVSSSTVYAFNCYVKDSGAGLLAGVLKIDLIDGSNTVINDDQSVANSSTVAFGTTTGTYAAFSGYFRTPSNLPTTVKIRVSISTGLTEGESMYIDDLALTPATLLYTGGPYAAAFRASTDVLKNDLWSVTIANNNAGVFQTQAEALFGMRELRLQLPSSGSNTINENLTQ